MITKEAFKELEKKGLIQIVNESEVMETVLQLSINKTGNYEYFDKYKELIDEYRSINYRITFYKNLEQNVFDFYVEPKTVGFKR